MPGTVSHYSLSDQILTTPGEEMKYDSQLQASDTVRMSNASTIYVQDEETTSYIRTDHENMAYVEEEDPRTD